MSTPTLSSPLSPRLQTTGGDSHGSQSPHRRGVVLPRLFTQAGQDVFETVAWERRDAVITDAKGGIVFEQRGVEIPAPWSQMATNVVVSKYFRGTLGTPERETSVRQLIGRVTRTLGQWGRRGHCFATEEDAQAFEDELAHLLLHQHVSFNSPVWFNMGVEAHPQCSACFINSVEDRMEAILTLAKTEGMLFKYGSGTGTNLSPLRSSRERLAGGGEASGPVSFMKGFDAFAGVIKSGGKTRRAAKMVILNVDHPDIVDFIECKAREEQKAWKLIDLGYDSGIDGEAYSSIFFQNSNNSVRVTDEFMRAVEKDGDWATRAVVSGQPMDTHRARDLMKRICDAAWVCGDPGLQFDSTINDWHTCANTARINASNPCSEYMFLDDSACNLASLNLMTFLRDDDSFDIPAFAHAVDVTITAQELIVDNASYPTPAIERNSHDYRPLGLGYANLGALLMALGVPYDSEAGREIAGAITALMCGEAYAQSARIASVTGPFPGHDRNREPMMRVMRKHRQAAYDLDGRHTPTELLRAARGAWDAAVELGARFGYRNAQATVLAPTGTIAFMMDCDTTGVEPDIALVKYKKLVGGGLLKIVNTTVPRALRRLGYGDPEIQAIVDHIDQHDTIEGAPHLAPEHLPVFDCAFRPLNGQRSIDPMGHIRMMAAVQPFISGAISKTVNMPPEATPADIEEAYVTAWRLGLKAIAIYRDGCKRTQPLNTGVEMAATSPAAAQAAEPEWKPRRHRLPNDRQALTHKFTVGGHDGYITVGLYEDGQPGEVFITMSKEGSTVSGLMDCFATAISLALQYGVPLPVLIDKFVHTRFEPNGFTKNPQVPIAKSLMDYLFRWLASKFLPEDEARKVGVVFPERGAEAADHHAGNGNGHHRGGPGQIELPIQRQPEQYIFHLERDAPPCPGCGAIMIRNGACYKCMECGSTNGCS
ncbi:MAG: vitamin B12-dependent ribonucleotide reductase [Candidatus Sumerlaeia bacterium]|nr:vitamin B12-dependent ribonucleotide reductase [Candidatus Sumerlaeia bacterium]